MTTAGTARFWVPEDLEAAIERRAAHYRALGSDAIECEVHDLLAHHEQFMDRECLSLYAGTNVLNPRAAQLMASSVGSRPSLGYPGAKYEMGMQHAEQLEIIAAELLTCTPTWPARGRATGSWPSPTARPGM